MVGNDVFQFFFEAGSGIALGALFFGVLPFFGARSLWRSIKKRLGGSRHAKKNVQEVKHTA